jgi:hypothetical protein
MLIIFHSAKQDVQKKGGVIKHEYSLIKGFTYAIHQSGPRPDPSRANHPINSAEFPEDHVGTLESDEHIHVEQDGEVKTQ